MYFLTFSLFLCSCQWLPIQAVARFEPHSVSDTSLVIRMIKGNNVSSFDMTVQIFDLDRLVEYRKTELRGSTKDQELIVKTKDSAREDQYKINDTVAFIDDLFITKDNVYIGVASVFKDTKKVSTIIVPEMRCSNGVLKPVTQQVIHHASFHFDLTILGDSNKSCSKICVYPYVRVNIANHTSETFRAKEWCGGIEEAKRLVSSSNSLHLLSLIFVYFLFYFN